MLFPSKPESLTTAWLSEALKRPIQGFQVEHFSEGAGVMGLVTRVHIDGDNGPASIIAKFPSPAPENRVVAQTYDMYGREIRFYQNLADKLPIRTPTCLHAQHDADSDDFVLLLEDLRGLRIGDQVAGCTLEEARLVVDTVAHLHASGWAINNDADPNSPYAQLISHNNPMQRDGMVAGFQAGWPVVVERFADMIPASARHVGERMPKRVGALLHEICTDPVCFSHTDVRLDNIFFGNDEIALVDWQAICTSAPEQDLAYFITQSVPPAVREQEDLVARYHRTLTGLGIDYDAQRLRHRYRVSALYLLCFAVVIAGTLDMGNERGQALARTLMSNCLSALDELNAFDLL